MTKKSNFADRMSSADGGAFFEFIPTKEDIEHGRELMNKLFKDLEFYDSWEDIFIKQHTSSKDDEK